MKTMVMNWRRSAIHLIRSGNCRAGQGRFSPNRRSLIRWSRTLRAPGRMSGLQPAQQGTGALATGRSVCTDRVSDWHLACLYKHRTVSRLFDQCEWCCHGRWRGSYSQTDATLSMQSDWSRHSARIDASGNYRKYLDSDSLDLPTADIKAGLTLDLVDGVTADCELELQLHDRIGDQHEYHRCGGEPTGCPLGPARWGFARTGGKLVYSIARQCRANRLRSH